MDVILFPDVVAITIDYLKAQLADRGPAVSVTSKVPNPRPATFVVVRRLGGIRLNLVVDDAQVTIESWANDDDEAHDLAQLCRGLVFAMRGTVQDGTAVYRVGELAGPQDLPDPPSSQSRYVHNVQIAARGRAEQPGS